MITDRRAIAIWSLTVIVPAAAVVTGCSEKRHENRTLEARRDVQVEKRESEDERQPDEDQIAEDCSAFVRSTKVVPAGAPSTECPGCSPTGVDLLSFRQMKTDAVSCSGDTCNVTVTIRAAFNPGSGERIAGGLTAWIPAEQRSAYLSGKVPPGEEVFRVQVTYKRRGNAWRAVEFDRAGGG